MKTFRDAVCERFDVTIEHYEEEVLWRSFFPHALALGRLMWALHMGRFREDLELIRSIAHCTSVAEVCMELNDSRYHRGLHGLGRRVLRVRVSGRKLVELAGLLLRN